MMAKFASALLTFCLLSALLFLQPDKHPSPPAEPQQEQDSNPDPDSAEPRMSYGMHAKKKTKSGRKKNAHISNWWHAGPHQSCPFAKKNIEEEREIFREPRT